MNRHIAALEADVAIYEALLKPLVRSTTHDVTHEVYDTNEDPDCEVIPVQRIMKKSRFSK